MNKGFSLVQVLITTAIFLFIFAGLITVLLSGTNIYVRNAAILDLKNQQRNAIDRMTRVLRTAIPDNVTIVNNQSGSYLSSSDYIVFNTPLRSNVKYMLNSSGQLIWASGSGAITGSILATNVSGFQLNYSATDLVLFLDLTSTKTFRNYNVSVSTKAKVRLRNDPE